MIQVRPYQNQDQEALLKIIALNIPDFFAEEEKDDFKTYLEQHREDYFVVTDNAEIVGGGGVNYLDTEVRISWDLIHPDAHGKGLGSRLVQHRLQHIKQKLQAPKIVVRTSQLAFKFYSKFGFKVQEIVPDFWSKGYDLYYMVLDE